MEVINLAEPECHKGDDPNVKIAEYEEFVDRYTRAVCKRHDRLTKALDLSEARLADSLRKIERLQSQRDELQVQVDRMEQVSKIITALSFVTVSILLWIGLQPYLG